MSNSLKYAKQLQELGVPRDQDEAQVQIMNEMMENGFATREDFKDLKLELRHRFEIVEQKIIQSEQRMTIKLGTIVSIAIGIAVTITHLVK